MTSSEIRNKFLKFFEERGHKVVPSAPVIPYDDPTLLFTNAGMNQFKDVFLGTGTREYSRAVDSQKCIRVSGKHNDLEEVGRDTYHHTLFEMLGNWSFGDYYKKEAIGWAWELLTKVWGLEKRRLYATVFETDDESEQLWKQVTDIDPSHVLRFGKKDNFWEMGETGPCGPCSEIHVDLTADLSGGKLVNAGDARVMEIWNLVFIQYDRDANGTLAPLPAKHVDTGMGFERICAVLQGKRSNYDTDVFVPIIRRISEVTKKPYDGSVIPVSGSGRAEERKQSEIMNPQSEIDTACRVIADHVRMLTFSVADGGIPSNEGRGYVMRRILRRAARFGRTLGMHEPFIYKIVEAVVRSMGDQYPEIKEKQSHVERVIKGEEESFNATLDRGLEIFESVIQQLDRSGTFPGDEAFKLYDTYGFPLDLTEMMAAERGLTVDSSKFLELMEEQKVRSRAATREGTISGRAAISNDAAMTRGIESPTKFIGYDHLESFSILNQVIGETTVALDQTPLYVESGGQIGDVGIIDQGNFIARVLGSAKKNTQIVHHLQVQKGSPIDLIGKKVHVSVDAPRRRNIERNHSATHIVHEALRRVLGTHAHQQGSLVAPDHLRFDFNHFERITPDQLKAIEEIVNEKISQSIDVHALNDPNDWLTIDEAKKKYPNVKMFFGDKYGDRVRIVEIDPQFSVELCGGTHVKNTNEIGLFKITSEASIASGIRRIEAVTGEGLRQFVEDQLKKMSEMNERLEKLIGEMESLEKQLGRTHESTVNSRPVPAPRVDSSQLSRESLGELDRVLHEREQTLEQCAKDVVDLKKEVSKARVKVASSGIEDIVGRGSALNGFTLISERIEVGTADELKSLGDALRSKIVSGIGILGAVVDEKVSLVCVVTDDLIKEKKLQAGKIVGELAKRVGGGGGGRPHLATAGGKDVAKLDDALKDARSIVQSMLSS